MSARDDGGPAFPLPDKEPNGNGDVIPQWTQPGMTLRDYFAAHAPELPIPPQIDLKAYAAAKAKWCYWYADAMLAERSKR